MAPDASEQVVPHRRWFRAGPIALATLLFAVISAAFMAPVLADCGHAVFGPHLGDSTGGGVWIAWNFRSAGSPFTATTNALGGPHPGDLWDTRWITALTWLVPYFFTSKIFSPTCTWNVAMCAGFVADGVAMYLFIRWLTRDSRIAWIAGYAYAFTPYHIEKSYGHIGYLYTWIFPLLLWSLIAFFQSPTRKRALICATALAIAGYSDGYFVLFAPTMVVTISVAGLILMHRRRSSDTRYRRGVAWILLTAIGLMAPILTTLVLERKQFNTTLVRPAQDLIIFSARPLEYLLPSHDHPVFGKLVSAYTDHHLHDSNYGEQVLYIGTVVLISALVFVYLAMSRRWPRQLAARLPVSPRFLAITLSTTAVVAVVASAPTHVMGIPMPSALIYAFVPYWRDYARFSIVVDTMAVTLAAIAWMRLAARPRGAFWLVGLLALIAFDLAAVRPVWSYSVQTPAIYRWLATVPGSPLVAEVPMNPAGSGQDLFYRTFQPVHGKPIVNDPPAGSDYVQAQAGMLDINAPQTIPALRALGVTYILVHRNLYTDPTRVTQLSDPTVSVEFRSATDIGYKIGPGPVAEAVLGIGGGFSPGEESWPRTVQWSTGPADLPIIGLGPTATRQFHVSFTASSYGPDRRLVVTQAGHTLWSGLVSQASAVSFDTLDRAPIHLAASPGPTCVQALQPASTDDRCLSVNVQNLSLTPLWVHYRP